MKRLAILLCMVLLSAPGFSQGPGRMPGPILMGNIGRDARATFVGKQPGLQRDARWIELKTKNIK